MTTASGYRNAAISPRITNALLTAIHRARQGITTATIARARPTVDLNQRECWRGYAV